VTKRDDFGAAVELLADLVAERVVRRLRDDRNGWIDQSASPLGSRRHCAVVRRRVAAGDSGACKVGRRFLLTQEALAEELTASGAHSRKNRSLKETLASSSVTERLQSKLRLVGDDN